MHNSKEARIKHVTALNKVQPKMLLKELIATVEQIRCEHKEEQEVHHVMKSHKQLKKDTTGVKDSS